VEQLAAVDTPKRISDRPLRVVLFAAKHEEHKMICQGRVEYGNLRSGMVRYSSAWCACCPRGPQRMAARTQRQCGTGVPVLWLHGAFAVAVQRRRASTALLHVCKAAAECHAACPSQKLEQARSAAEPGLLSALCQWRRRSSSARHCFHAQTCATLHLPGAAGMTKRAVRSNHAEIAVFACEPGQAVTTDWLFN
jgi:hypothetical protein